MQFLSFTPFRLPTVAFGLLLVVTLSATLTVGQDPAGNATRQDFWWPQFRGPDSQNSIEGALPTKWNEQDGIVWKAELPGRGSSSPVILGNRTYLTAYSGYGISATEPGDLGTLVHHVICLDRNTGENVWERHIRGTLIPQRLNPNLLNHGFASSTCATDGQALFTFFGVTGVYAFDLNGKMLWRNEVGFDTDNFGSSASLMVHNDLVIVNASIESQTVYAFDKKTGQAVWKIEDVNRSWSMPVVGKTSEGADELIISSENVVRGVDPATGEPLWSCSGIQDYVIPVPVVRDGVVYCNGGRKNQLMAIRLGGRGDVTETHKLWEARYGANVSSPIVTENVIYLMSDNGLFQAFDRKTGKTLNRKRTPTRKRVFASPLLAGDCLYFPTTDAGILVARAKPEFEKIAVNRLAVEKEEIKAALAVAGNRIYCRTDKYCYCLGKTKSKPSFVKRTRVVDLEKTIPGMRRFDVASESGRPKQYTRYLSGDTEQLVKVMLAPYLSVITDEQTQSSRKIILASVPKFDEFRQQRNEVHWDFLSGKLTDRRAYFQKMSAIEKSTIRYNQKVRMEIKAQFSKEQMDQHNAEAAEWRRKQELKQKSAADQQQSKDR